MLKIPLNVLTPLSGQIRTHALRMLDRNNQSLKDILQTLQLYQEHVDDGEDSRTEAPISRKEILQGLISALHSDQ